MGKTVHELRHNGYIAQWEMDFEAMEFVGTVINPPLYACAMFHAPDARGFVREFERLVEEYEKSALVSEHWVEAKHDAGKPRLALCPPAIIESIGAVRTYGTAKYGSPDNWRKVEPERYADALMRHITAWLRDPNGIDEESGLPHLAHAATNIAFLLEMEVK